MNPLPPDESSVWLSDIPLVSEDVEAGLQTQITAAHQVGDNEKRRARDPGEAGKWEVDWGWIIYINSLLPVHQYACLPHSRTVDEVVDLKIKFQLNI